MMGERVKRAGSSYIIFSEMPTSKGRGAAASPMLEAAALDDPPPAASRYERRYGRDRFNYYAQFSFDENDFRIDLPNETLHPDEANRLLSEREGFFWLRTVNGTGHPDTRDFDPLQKIYGYGQERLAAADMLFLLFDVWSVPVDFCWYVTAALFEGGEQWEMDEPIV